ncbi:hypothetical protein [Burkholderia pseudomallei]|uniref:hypothetical protein n=1 Tax=Burkholderia pseudomallei TaxID=28450 RepID=UPI00190FACAA|nr:hypothetical protein [Burkholderia pseudomallei]
MLLKRRRENRMREMKKRVECLFADAAIRHARSTRGQRHCFKERRGKGAKFADEIGSISGMAGQRFARRVER